MNLQSLQSKRPQLASWLSVVIFTSVLSAGVATADSGLSRSIDRPADAEKMQPAIASAKSVSISGNGGQLVGQLVVRGTTAAAWAALTDYNNFAAFLPNVETSRVISRSGSQVTFEQVNVLRVASLPLRNRVVVHAAEQRPSQIQFTVMDGDAQVLQGVWQIQSAGGGQVAVTHQASITRGGAYSSVYRSQLETTLNALGREIERRSR